MLAASEVVSVVGRRYQPDRDTVPWPVDHLDPITGAERSLLQDGQVSARPSGRAGKRGSPILAPSFQQGTRGEVTCRTALPTRQRSPTSASVRSIPSVVRFSPNMPGSSVRSSWRSTRRSPPARRHRRPCPARHGRGGPPGRRPPGSRPAPQPGPRLGLPDRRGPGLSGQLDLPDSANIHRQQAAFNHGIPNDPRPRFVHMRSCSAVAWCALVVLARCWRPPRRSSYVNSVQTERAPEPNAWADGVLDAADVGRTIPDHVVHAGPVDGLYLPWPRGERWMPSRDRGCRACAP